MVIKNKMEEPHLACAVKDFKISSFYRVKFRVLSTQAIQCMLRVTSSLRPSAAVGVLGFGISDLEDAVFSDWKSWAGKQDHDSTLNTREMAWNSLVFSCFG